MAEQVTSIADKNPHRRPIKGKRRHEHDYLGLGAVS
jgi:hypothetical protein